MGAATMVRVTATALSHKVMNGSVAVMGAATMVRAAAIRPIGINKTGANKAGVNKIWDAATGGETTARTIAAIKAIGHIERIKG